MTCRRHSDLPQLCRSQNSALSALRPRPPHRRPSRTILPASVRGRRGRTPVHFRISGRSRLPHRAARQIRVPHVQMGCWKLPLTAGATPSSAACCCAMVLVVVNVAECSSKTCRFRRIAAVHSSHRPTRCRSYGIGRGRGEAVSIRPARERPARRRQAARQQPAYCSAVHLRSFALPNCPPRSVPAARCLVRPSRPSVDHVKTPVHRPQSARAKLPRYCVYGGESHPEDRNGSRCRERSTPPEP